MPPSIGNIIKTDKLPNAIILNPIKVYVQHNTAMIAAIIREYGFTINSSFRANVKSRKINDVVKPERVENVSDATTVLPHLKN